MDSTVFSFGHLSSRLKELSFDNLPGVEAQLKMAPSIREVDIRQMGVGKSPVPSAVLLLFYPSNNGQARLVFIKRTDYGGAHSGQISFPGGKYDETDQSLASTALRETYEEIGALPQQVEIIGKLTDLYIPPSNFLVSPFVAISSTTPRFNIDPNEVAGLVEVEVREFFNSENRRVENIRLQEGFFFETPCFFIKGHIVWGATAMILNELLEFLEISQDN